MYGFLRNVHDQSESEADDVHASTVQYLQRVGLGTSGREGRINTGNVGRRTLRRLQNARLVANNAVGQRMQLTGQDAATAAEAELKGYFTRTNTKPIFDSESRPFFEDSGLDFEVLYKTRKSRRRGHDSNDDDDAYLDPEQRELERQNRRLERMARRRAMKRQGDVEKLDETLKQLRIRDIRLAALKPDAVVLDVATRTPEDDEDQEEEEVFETASRGPEDSGEEKSTEAKVDASAKIPKPTRRVTAAYALLDALLLDCASDNEQIQTAVRKQIKQNVGLIREAIERRSTEDERATVAPGTGDVAAHVAAWLSIPGGHPLVAPADVKVVAKAIKPLRARRQGGLSESELSDGGNVMAGQQPEGDGNIASASPSNDDQEESSLKSRTKSVQFAMHRNEINIISSIVKQRREEEAAKIREQEQITHEEREKLVRKHANALRQSASQNVDDAARALKLAVEELAYYYTDVDDTDDDLDGAMRAELRKTRKQVEKRIVHHKESSANAPESSDSVDVNVSLDPVDYFNLLEGTYQKSLRRAAYSPFLTELEALLIPYKFNQPINRKACKPFTFEFVQVPTPEQETPVLGSSQSAASISHHVKDPSALCIVCHDSYGRLLARGVAQFHGVSCDEVVTPSNQKVTVIRRSNVLGKFSRHPYSLQAYLKKIVSE